MLVQDADLERFVGDGAAFETLLNCLVRAEAPLCGIAQHRIDWDYRTNLGDGGRDLIVHDASATPSRTFIPAAPSIWSAKSGADGLKRSVFKNEIKDHAKVLDHLRSGGTYVWCAIAPASADAREALREEADELAAAEGFAPTSIRFHFRDTTAEWLRQHPGVAALFLPTPRGWKTLAEWGQLDRNFSVPWVSFGARAKLVRRIEDHLLGKGEPAVLYLVGWSGIGKTRSALEACRLSEGLASVLYFANPEAFTQAEDFLVRSAELGAVIVVDEVEPDEYESLRDRLRAQADRLRVLAIGVGSTGSTMPAGAVEVPAPETANEVIDVIRSSDPALSVDEAGHLARWCDHDLRLALLLVETNRSDPWLTAGPIASVDFVWRRILALFEKQIGDVAEFRRHYELLTICLDVGTEGSVRAELDYLAECLGENVARLDRSIGVAIDVGLGRQHGRFFEASPKSLARRLFESVGWSQIKSRVASFVQGMPSIRLRRRFIERAHGCHQDVRTAIARALEEWAEGFFSPRSLEVIQTREASRLFAAYAELNPEHGLAWLREAVTSASVEALRAFDGESERGGWRGRRQVVWLCEHLAQFEEHFWDCEEILYRLAIHETEERIANNSLNVWRGLFLPMFSWTPIPIDERLALLERRFREASPSERAFVVEAFIGAAEEPHGRAIPPEIVGGRRVPGEWRPATHGELFSVRARIAESLVAAIRSLPPDEQEAYASVVIGHVSTLLLLGLQPTLENWVSAGGFSEPTIRRLRTALDSYIDWLHLKAGAREDLGIEVSEQEKRWAEKKLAEVRPWRDAIEPTSLEDRVREVTGRDYWEHPDVAVGGWENQGAVYETVATMVLGEPAVIRTLADWFESGARSALEFGRALGSLDVEWAVRDIVLDLFAEGRCVDLVSGYYAGVAWRCGSLPAVVVERLDAAAAEHPRAAAIVTLNADPGERGLMRLFDCAPRSGSNASSLFRPLQQRNWSKTLTDTHRVAIVRALLQLDRSGDPTACAIALGIASMWRHLKITASEELSTALLELLEASLEGHENFATWEWTGAMSLVSRSVAGEKIRVLARVLIEDVGIAWQLRSDAKTMLTNLARDYPDLVLERVGALALDPNVSRSLIFESWPGLVSALPFEAVRKWVEANGREAAEFIAQHCQSPLPTAENPAFVPELTEWLLTAFENDDEVFRAFIGGRHGHETFFGPISAAFAGVEERMQPYLRHPLRRVREWARYEIRHAQRMSAFDLRDDEFGRE